MAYRAKCKGQGCTLKVTYVPQNVIGTYEFIASEQDLEPVTVYLTCRDNHSAPYDFPAEFSQEAE